MPRRAHSDTTARDACARELTSFGWMLTLSSAANRFWYSELDSLFV